MSIECTSSNWQRIIFKTDDIIIPLELFDQNCPKLSAKPQAWNEELLSEGATGGSQELGLAANSLVLISLDPIEFMINCKSTNVTWNRFWAWIFCTSSHFSVDPQYNWHVECLEVHVSSSHSGTSSSHIFLSPFSSVKLTQIHLIPWNISWSAGSFRRVMYMNGLNTALETNGWNHQSSGLVVPSLCYMDHW